MRVWRLGDNVDTDAVAPGRYMKLGIEEIAAHCAARLPPFKTPKRIYVVDRLPRSDRGKVIRDSLREQWLKENGSG